VYSVPEAARILDAPEWLVRRLVDQHLQIVRLGRYRGILAEQLPALRRLVAEKGYPRGPENGAA
jgi:hypothetical protein